MLSVEYRMEVAKFDHLATHSNYLYRADLVDGRRLVLRVARSDAVARGNIMAEVAWLRHLAADPEIFVAEPVSTPDGRFVLSLDTTEGHLPCVLFKWVPGEPLGAEAGTSGYRAMGRLSALLHRHGDWRPEAGTVLRRWDRVFYQTRQPVVIDDYRYDHFFEGHRRIIRKTMEVLDPVLMRRWHDGNPMVVHGDLHEWNVHLYMGRAWAIDFEHVMLATADQDISVSLYGARNRSDLGSLIAAFRAGYSEHRPWPVESTSVLEDYWAARQVMLMNHAVQILSEREARDYLSRVMPWLEGYSARRLEDPGPTT